MGKIFYVMGKSSSGKDTIFARLINREELGLRTIVGYTTRPMRQGEENGREYYFVDEEKLNRLKKLGKVIEQRAYNTVFGIWYYFTVDDEQIDLDNNSYIVIGTLESYRDVRDFYGMDKVVPIYVEVEDGERLIRAIERERRQELPKYEEICRRFLADSEDFSKEKIREAGIKKAYINTDIGKCTDEIAADIITENKKLYE